jgi:PIN domain nuclease of toxin-antitoxin system
LSDHVLDASAVLASVFREPGHDVVDAVMGNSIMTSVNLAEVASKLSDRGYTEETIRWTLSQLAVEVIAFSRVTATESGLLRSATRSLGLSLGDRACLALAIERGVPALTADRRWTSARTKAKVELIR